MKTSEKIIEIFTIGFYAIAISFLLGWGCWGYPIKYIIEKQVLWPILLLITLSLPITLYLFFTIRNHIKDYMNNTTD